MSISNRLPQLLLAALLAVSASGCGRKPPAAPPTLWQALPLNTAADFRGIWFVDADRGWIVGGRHDIAGGLIGRTQDGGSTWKYTSGAVSAETFGRGCEFVSVHFFDPQRGVVAGCGAVITTQDGGESWDQAVSGWGLRWLWTVHFIDDRLGWAIGEGDALVSADAGQKWDKFKPADGGTVQGRAIQFLDGNNGWLVGKNAKLMTTGDGGQSWTAVALPLPPGNKPDLRAIYFVDSRHGWVVGEEGTIFNTRDGGATWTMQDTGLADARSAARLEKIQTARGVQTIDAGDRTPGLTLASVRFIDASRGWLVGHFSHHARSLILHTRDGGASWTVEADISGEELKALYVLDSDHMWAVGARTREGMQSIYRRVASPAPLGRS